MLSRRDAAPPSLARVQHARLQPQAAVPSGQALPHPPSLAPSRRRKQAYQAVPPAQCAPVRPGVQDAGAPQAPHGVFYRVDSVYLASLILSVPALSM